jgi:hypothetical protein
LRFGAFQVKKGMIGWTALGIVKVWIHEDFSSNFVEELSSDEQMLEDIFTVLDFSQTINLLK